MFPHSRKAEAGGKVAKELAAGQPRRRVAPRYCASSETRIHIAIRAVAPRRNEERRRKYPAGPRFGSHAIRPRRHTRRLEPFSGRRNVVVAPVVVVRAEAL